MLEFWFDSARATKMGLYDNRIFFERTSNHPTGETTRFALLQGNRRMQYEKFREFLVFGSGPSLDDIAAAAREVAIKYRWLGFTLHEGNPAKLIRDLEIVQW